MSWNETISFTPPAAPGNNATVKLFDSTTMLGNEPAKMLAVLGINRIEVSFLSVDQASAALGLRSYASSNNGTNWDETQAAIAVGATVAGTVNTFDYPVDRFDDFKLEYTAGASGPTVWRVSIKGIVGKRVVST